MDMDTSLSYVEQLQGEHDDVFFFDGIECCVSFFVDIASLHHCDPPRVLINPSFMKAPAWVIQAVLYHELGHGKLQTVQQARSGNATRVTWIMKGQIPPNELEADEYAADRVGYANLAYAHDWVMCNCDLCPLAMVELQMRVDYLLQRSYEEKEEK